MVDLMKQRKAAAAVMLAAFFACGCSGPYLRTMAFSPETNSIYVAEDGTISSAMVEEYESGDVRQDELWAFVTNEVALFNEQLGASGSAQNEKGKEALPVSVESCTAADGKMTAVYAYRDSSCFLQFSENYYGTSFRPTAFETAEVEEGRQQGWLDGGELMKSGKGREPAAVGAQELEKLDKGRIVRIETENPLEIQTEGAIRYMSKGVVLSKRNTAQVPAGTYYLIFW